jgi:hypothetical protein
MRTTSSKYSVRITSLWMRARAQTPWRQVQGNSSELRPWGMLRCTPDLLHGRLPCSMTGRYLDTVRVCAKAWNLESMYVPSTVAELTHCSACRLCAASCAATAMHAYLHFRSPHAAQLRQAICSTTRLLTAAHFANRLRPSEPRGQSVHDHCVGPFALEGTAGRDYGGGVGNQAVEVRRQVHAWRGGRCSRWCCKRRRRRIDPRRGRKCCCHGEGGLEGGPVVCGRQGGGCL